MPARNPQLKRTVELTVPWNGGIEQRNGTPEWNDGMNVGIEGWNRRMELGDGIGGFGGIGRWNQPRNRTLESTTKSGDETER